MISIHALREEGDGLLWDYYNLQDLFLSTPSARRATRSDARRCRPREISIHALREEGDGVEDHEGLVLVQFLSTPSARRATIGERRLTDFLTISIHALREEGDMRARQASYTSWVFLSTPSARRATAKTETKSLFSNKLYNILHEFRRALIYNGSRSYPNHAK